MSVYVVVCAWVSVIYISNKLTVIIFIFKVLASQMKHYTESRDLDKITRLQGEVSDVKDILVKNIGELIQSLPFCY